jgi:sugar phosphate isomerase/epimerase
MIPTLSQVCSLPSSFEDDVTEYASGGCHYLETWLTKLEQALQRSDADSLRQLLEEHHVEIPAASFQGGLFQAPNAGFDESWKTFQERLKLCAAMRIATLVVSGDIREDLAQSVVDRTTERLAQMADVAAAHDVTIAFEFQAKATFANNLQTAVSLVESINHPALKICLDLFHFSIGPSKIADLQLLSPTNLGHVQLCDLADVALELATDRDRILPGEGDLPVEPLMRRLAEIGYARAVSI